MTYPARFFLALVNTTLFGVVFLSASTLAGYALAAILSAAVMAAYMET